ncbi:hypothetical protein KJ693_05080 [bacterium]|nr:hypothetical protein [bacterium]
MNPDVRGVKKREIKQLFPNCTFDFHRTTLAPPITRPILLSGLLPSGKAQGFEYPLVSNYQKLARRE